MKRDGIPLESLISNLSDNTDYMQGKKSGLETKLHEKAPNMLHIGGDICHVIHSAMKRLCSLFIVFVEKVLHDLNVDTKFSSDIKDYLQEILFYVELMLSLYLIPPRGISHCWLSAYNCTNKICPMIDALYVLDYPWVPKTEKYLHKIKFNA